ncbi:hypothetical protein U91I_02910 [alpha proteobacterium U9-1i]|nr:hypothetical protein U91I_02910 [alpha proteobacterium U9-1i]
MRYRIEYLFESTDERSVCHSAVTEGNLNDAEEAARRGRVLAQLSFGADGFQIRDLRDKGRIVSLEPFDPLKWALAGDHVIH